MHIKGDPGGDVLYLFQAYILSESRERADEFTVELNPNHQPWFDLEALEWAVRTYFRIAVVPRTRYLSGLPRTTRVDAQGLVKFRAGPDGGKPWTYVSGFSLDPYTDPRESRRR